MSTLKIHDECFSVDQDTVGPLPPPTQIGAPWTGAQMPYAGTYMPVPGQGYAPMPFNYANEPSLYGCVREESLHSGSGIFI